MNLGLTDATVLVAYLLAMVAFGIYMGRGAKNSTDFMVGGRDLPWYAVLCSIVATETSTVTFLSVPGIAYFGDLRFLQLPLGYIVGRLIVVTLLLPRYFRGEIVTAYEILSERFGGSVRTSASLLFIVTRTLGDGLRLFLGAIVLQKVAGLDMNVAIGALGAATILYTVLGGIRAVVWTDFVQFLVYMTGATIAFWILLDGIEGGFDTVTEIAATEGKLRIFDISFGWANDNNLWVGLVGGAVFAIGTHGVDQLMVQRYLCARSERQAGLALGLSGPLVLGQFVFFLLVGSALYAFYLQHPPGTPFSSTDKDEVFATFIVEHLPIGILGIVLGAVFSAAMSTLSSSLNSTATALVNDVFRIESDANRLRMVKLLTIAFGGAQISVGIVGQWLEDSVIFSVLGIQSFTVGIILGVFFLGMSRARVSTRSAMIGLVLGLAITATIKFGTPLAWPWFALVGSTITFACGKLAARLLDKP